MTVPIPPGWYADPHDPRLARWWTGVGWSDATMWRPGLGAGAPSAPSGPPRLDAVVEQLKAESTQPWGWRPVIIPLGTLIALIVASEVLAATVNPTGSVARILFAAAATFGVDAILVASVWLGGREVAHRLGGWARAFGWRRPHWSDLKYAGLGILVIFGARLAIGIAANALTSGRASEESQNLDIDHVSVVGAIVLFLVVAVWAPLIEELMFRGLLLRTFMRRWAFWPSAVLSSAIFGALHTYEVDTAAGALTLAASVGALGLVNCYLNRVTDSLVPGIIVHASFNALAVVVLIAQTA